MQSHFTLVSDGPQQLPPPPTSRFNGYMHRRPADLRESTNMYMPDLAGLWAEMRDLYMPLDQAWWPTAGGRYERRNGVMFPFFRTEQDLDWLRSASRYVAGYHRGHAGGLIRGYCGYVIGKGMTCKPTPIDGTSDPADMALVKAAEKELQDFSDRVLWPEMQQELFCNSLIDGDQGIWMFDMGDHLDVRTVLPENIRQPMGTDAKEWGFGRHTPADDVQRTIGWHVMDPDDYGAGTFIQDADFVYLPFVGPGGWNRTIRRGVPIFAFTTKTVIDCASKIENNMGEGVAIRQAIPYIEQQAEFTSREDAAADADFTADVKVTDPLGNGIQRNIRKARPGRVPRIPDGYSFVNPPAHPETESAINAIDAMIRGACAVLNAPPWMGGESGRNQGSYEKDLLKEAPLVKTGEQIQESYGNRFLKVMRKVLEIAVRCGRLRPETLTRLRLTMEHPSMAAQDPDKEATRDQLYVGMGVESVQSIQQRQGIDSEKTRAEIAEFNQWKAQQAAAAAPPAPAPQNGGEQPKPGETQPLVPGIDDEDADPFGTVKESLATMDKSDLCETARKLGLGDVRALGREAIRAKLRERLTPDLREAFTGMKTDSLGRDMYYQDGKHIPHPTDEQKAEIKAKGGETAEPKTSDDVHDIFRGLQQVESDGYETDEHTGEVSTNNFFKKTSKGEMSDVVFAMEKLHKQSGGGDSLAPTLEKHATQQEVKIADLKSTQPTVEEFKVAGLLSPAGAKRLASDAPRDLPVVVKHGGQLYAYDGQHRLTAKLIAGNDTAKVNYIDLDAMGEEMTDPPRIDLQESLRAFHCQGCGFTLAQSHARRLFPTGSSVEVSSTSNKRLRLRCPKCGVSRLWEPKRG